MPYENMQQGIYWARPIGGALNTNTNGKSFIAVEFELIHVAVNGQWSDVPNTTNEPIHCRARWYLTDSAWPFSEQRLRLVGFNGDFNSPAFSCDGIQLVCEHTQKDGKTYENWDLVDTGSRGAKPPAQPEIDKFNARWQAGTAASVLPAGPPPAMPPNTAQTQPPPQAPAAVAPPAEVTDPGDDIPY